MEFWGMNISRASLDWSVALVSLAAILSVDPVTLGRITGQPISAWFLLLNVRTSFTPRPGMWGPPLIFLAGFPASLFLSTQEVRIELRRSSCTRRSSLSVRSAS